jgi:hypothetical protein
MQIEGLLMANANGTPNTVKTRLLVFCIGLLLIIVALIACAQEGNMVLELKDVQFFKAQQTNTSPTMIKVSGLAFHSSLVVQKITTSQYDESLQLLVYLSPATKGLSGNFDYTLTVPASVITVSFGKDKIAIWSRAAGVIQKGSP